MGMDTNLQGRLRNTSLPKSHGLLPLFEAVINSIHSIEESGLSPELGRVKVEIVRSGQGALNFETGEKKRGPEAEGEIDGFSVTDNGIGFNDENMKSFETLDTEHKIVKGCRGVGRLLWLKAFDKINVASSFKTPDSRIIYRTFGFDKQSGVTTPKSEVKPADFKIETVLHLDGFVPRYREYSRKTIQAIANSLFEHCLWYFIREGGAPKIQVIGNDEAINLDDVYHEHMLSSAGAEAIELKGHKFDLTHVKLRSNSSQTHVIAYCAANRLVKEETINGKIPGLYGKIRDGENEFIYACYVSSEYLNERVRSERTDFDFDEDVTGMFSKTELTLSEIRQAVTDKVRAFLDRHLEANKKAGKDRVEQFVSKKAPRYRPILARISEDNLSIDPNMSDKDLDLTLHKHLADIENRLLSDGHDIMAPKVGEDADDYQKRLQEYLDTAEDIKKSDLANYVSHRKVILDLLCHAIERKDGKYAREDLIHKLIMPMGKDSSQILFDSCNLWLVDERLAFHNYLASDMTLNAMPITGSVSNKEPDLCALNVFDNPILVSEGTRLPLASIVVVELKRPMRNDATEGEEKDPIEQALGYLERIRDGKVTTAAGRQIPQSDSIPGFCYIICDLTPSIVKRCNIHDGIRTSDGLGFFFYNKHYKTYVEVLSFDRLVNSAKERNRAFFDKLGLPTN